MAPRVLLVYANPAVTPTPIPPVGMERVAGAFMAAGCRVRMSAPFLEEDPAAALAADLAWEPDLVGFSVRNVDDVLVVRGAEGPGELDTEFYLDAVRPLVGAAVAAVGPERVILGGTAVGAGPEAVIAYLGARRGVAGPGEDLCLALGAALVAGHGPVLPDDPRVVDLAAPRARPRGFGAGYRPGPGASPRMGSYVRLALARGGRVAVQLSAGCDRRCVFCVEARFTGHVVIPRPVDDVVAEIEALRVAGVRRFWLAASELNAPHDRHAVEVLRRLAGRGLDLAGFFQAAPVSDALLDAMEAAGMDPEAVNFELGHLDDRILRAGGGPANRAAIDRLVETWLRRGYRRLGGSVLLGAHPLETEETVDGAIRAAREIDAALPAGLGLAYAAGGRVYPETPLAAWVRANPEAAAPWLVGDPDPTFVRVVVFCKPLRPRALLARIAAGLAGTKGPMGPMNVELPAPGPAMEAEALVTRGILRAHEERAAEAAAALRAALDRVPAHLEGLKQLALVSANALGDREAALDALRRLDAALPPGDARRVEVDAARRALTGS